MQALTKNTITDLVDKYVEIYIQEQTEYCQTHAQVIENLSYVVDYIEDVIFHLTYGNSVVMKA